ncbi:hypothetical protein [Burkholderia sp. Ac-20365]|uniref:hypothetical protein n=1 Tax=Burkholderia sp. Ac-20365 TaxID=2703897 RepID=UPI00197B8F71|nr:hypothetical protein [Burkholderia sp. Ac-20365]MBN3761028.1 hypothetical protein [Burkholderia sp. Ac-20365]
MSQIFTAPAFDAKNRLKQFGLDLSLNQIKESFAPFFGYHHLTDMLPDMEEISDHLSRQNVLLVLQCPAGLEWVNRKIGGDPEKRVVPAYQILKQTLCSMLPGSCFDNESDLLDQWVKEKLSHHLLHDYVPQVATAQEKVSRRCTIFESADIDCQDLILVREPLWHIEYMGNLYAPTQDGTPDYLGEQIGTSSMLTFDKVGRTMLVKEFAANTNAFAWKPHVGMGGIEL